MVAKQSSIGACSAFLVQQQSIIHRVSGHMWGSYSRGIFTTCTIAAACWVIMASVLLELLKLQFFRMKHPIRSGNSPYLLKTAACIEVLQELDMTSVSYPSFTAVKDRGNADRLCNAIMSTWTRILRESLQNLVESVPWSIEAVLRALPSVSIVYLYRVVMIIEFPNR